MTSILGYTDLLKGGMIYVDDFWGDAAWRQWSSEIGRVLPEYPIIDIPRDVCTFYEFYRAEELIEIGRDRAARILSSSEEGDQSPLTRR